MATPFSNILEAVVDKTPGAIGGAFAASDGEMVDSIAKSDPDEWALVTAHYGIVLGHVQSALRTFHYGEAEFVLMTHGQLDILMHAVAEGYYALLAVKHPAPLGRVMGELEQAAGALRKEMM
jgi:predicted regulator of Ras-like GTPase activity (Roadblock/LC7/MglB family)